MLTQPYCAYARRRCLILQRNPEFNNPDDVWQFVRLWDFADCVLKGGVSANVTEAVTEGESWAYKKPLNGFKLKTLIPKQSNKEAVKAVSGFRASTMPKTGTIKRRMRERWGRTSAEIE